MPIIDGERLNYKRFRGDVYRQYATGQFVRARPFRPEFNDGELERGFTVKEGGKTELGLGWAGTGDGRTGWISERVYRPGFHGDGSYGPTEVVTCRISFGLPSHSTALAASPSDHDTSTADADADADADTSNTATSETNATFDRIELQYDTRDIHVPKSSTTESDPEDGIHLIRTITHSLPLTKLSYISRVPVQPSQDPGAPSQDRGLPSRDALQVIDLPLEWAAMLGGRVTCTVVFKETLRRYEGHVFFPQGGMMECLEVGVKWDVVLCEELCRPDVIALWGQRGG